MTSSKHQDGPFSSDQLNFNLDPVETKTAWIKVKNRTGGKLKNIALKVGKKATEDAFNVRYFHGSENITGDVRGAGYEFDLNAGKATKFKALIKNKEKGAMCFMAEVEHPQAGDAAVFVAANTPC